MDSGPFVVSATSRFRDGADYAYVALRVAVADQGLEPERAAVADFNPESSLMAEGAPYERHHVVIVTDDDRAFDGWLTIDPAGQRFDAWHEIPSRLISNADELARQLSRNLRMKREWNEGLPRWVSGPRDFIYNESVQAARQFLDIADASSN